ncbi:MAG: hypothetical protein Q4G13_03475 [Moraxella sp.]|nr:hypothetical protein [Moraxella sp.]
MPYVFAILVVANAAVMGYFLLVDRSNTTDYSVQLAKSTITTPVSFSNKSGDIPPQIGEK